MRLRSSCALANLMRESFSLLPVALVPLAGACLKFPQMSLIARLLPNRAKISLMVIPGQDACVGKKTD